MKQTHTPQVFLIAKTQVHRGGIEGFLKAVGVKDPGEMAERYVLGEPGEALIELAGRTCYRSFEVGLNPNVKMIRENREKYINNILESKHGSVLEHATTTFAFFGVSRVFTHEIVRHRAGTAFSQESLRYVRIEEIPFWIPPTLDVPLVGGLIKATIKGIEKGYRLLVERFHLKETINFNQKKAITSALRRILPIGISTCIIVTANHRAWRYIIEQRCSGHGEEEIAMVIYKVAKILKGEFSSIYQDMEIQGHDLITFGNSKI